MTETLTLTVDGEEVTVPAGTTLLKVAESLGKDIPTICYHDRTTSKALCRTCVVEVEGARVLLPSCVAEVSEGMNVVTRNERVERSRRTILEMLESAVDISESPEIRRMLEDYAAEDQRFPEAELRQLPLYDDNPMYIRDYSKCVLCWRCVQVCAEDAQYTFAINFEGRGFNTRIGTFFDKPMPETTCVFCGQCVDVCPTGALKSKRQWLFERGVAPDEIMSLTRTERKKARRKN
jgi:NADH dehydrogenase/NADH:ubiquinone oxidoreductase subunit G